MPLSTVIVLPTRQYLITIDWTPEAHRFWLEGGEELITGIAALATLLAILQVAMLALLFPY